MDIDGKKNKTSQHLHLFFHEMHKSDKTIREFTIVIRLMVQNTKVILKNHGLPGSRKQVNHIIFLVHKTISNVRSRKAREDKIKKTGKVERTDVLV